jgi:hypothetical protein
MTSNLDQVQDVKATDNTAVANPLITEVNQSLATSSGKNTTMMDYLKAGTAKVNEIFGALHLTDDEVKGPALLSDSTKPADNAKPTDSTKPADSSKVAADAPTQTADTAKPASDTNAQTADPAKQLAQLKNDVADASKVSDPATKTAPDATALTNEITVPSPSPVESAKTAAAIEDGLHWYKSDDFKDIENSLKGKTPEEIKAIDEAFKKEHDGKGIEETLVKRWADHPADMIQIIALMHPPEAKLAAPAKPEATPEQIKAADAKALDSIQKDPEIQAKHDELIKHAKETMTGPELTKFTNNLDKFEAREAGVQRQYEKEFEAKGMSPDKAAAEAEKKAHQQVKDTFDNVEKLVAHNPKAPVSDRDRATLAQEVMNHAASPESVSQGHYGTCTVASVESRTYDKDPAQASRVVSEVATTGQYNVPGHAPIKLDTQSLHKQGDSTHTPTGEKDNNRDYASQLFEVTAVNVMLQQKNESTTPHGQLRYEQHAPQKGQTPDDSGERLMDYSTHPPKVLQKDIAMGANELAYVSKQISPESSEGTVAITGYSLAEMNRELVELECKVHGLNGGKMFDTTDPNWVNKAHDTVGHSTMSDKDKAEVNKYIDDYETQRKLEADPSVLHVHNEQEMKTALAQLKHDGKLPVIVQVNTENEPFWSDSHGGDAGGAGGEHVINITDYDEKTGKVTIRNQWDKDADHDVSTKDLYDATRFPKEEIPALQKEVDDSKASGHRDYVKEYELLRLERQYGKITDADYEKQAVQVTIDKARDLHDGKITADENTAANKEFVQMYYNLKDSNKPADKKLAQQLQKESSAGVKALGYDN